ncbi:MAG: YihY/virulence factor BrkB family protein, partial [Pseudonocardiales bacterium]
PIYVAIAAHVSPTLGSHGGGLIVLVWLYLMTLSLFLGADLNATCLPRPARGDNSTGARR